MDGKKDPKADAAPDADAEAGAEADWDADTERLLRMHAAGAVGTSLVPVPLLDLALLTGVQLNMLRSLARRYGVPFSEEAGRAVIASLVGTGVSLSSASLLKLIPVVGQVLGYVAFSAVAGASTYALGRVFVQHLASGGTFLTLDPAKVRAYYQQQFEKERHLPPEPEENRKP